MDKTPNPSSLIKRWKNKKNKTYAIGIREGQMFILCHACGHRSYHKGDIVNRYCGFCHKFLGI